MRQHLIYLLLIGICWEINASPRNPQQAKDCALAFFEGKTTIGNNHVHKASKPTLRLAATLKKATKEEAAFYVFNRGEKDGFVLISADDRTPEILGYADEGNFNLNEIPDNMRGWLTNYQREIERLDDLGDDYQGSRMAQLTTEVEPLLGDIQWNQSGPYNYLCPLVDNDNGQKENVVTGCVATATAQVMRYYRYPAKGVGSHSYTAPTINQTLSVDFNTEYDWDNMLPRYKQGEYTNWEAAAVAKLMYHVGVACDMDYSLHSSGAITVQMKEALTNYFQYSKEARFISRDYYKGDWEALMRSELNQKRPLIYSGQTYTHGGHCFVCDGYDQDGFFHINWGWGGQSNGYFRLTVLYPSAQGIGAASSGKGYCFDQSAIIYLKPQTEGTPSAFVLNYRSININQTKVGRFSSMSFTIDYLIANGGSAKGKIAMLIMQDGYIKDKIGSTSVDFKPGYGYRDLTLSGTTIMLESGNYEMALGYLPDNDDTWKLIAGEGGQVYYFDLEATSDMRYISDRMLNHSKPFIMNLKERDRWIEDLRTHVDLEVYLSSSYHAYRDSVILLLTDSATHEQVYRSSPFYLDINPGQSTTVELDLKVTHSGTFCPHLITRENTDEWWSYVRVEDDDICMPTNIQTTIEDSLVRISWEGLIDVSDLNIIDENYEWIVDTLLPPSITYWEGTLKPGKYSCYIGGRYYERGERTYNGYTYKIATYTFEVKEQSEEEQHGEYIIVAKRQSGNWFYMTSDCGTAKTSRFQAIDTQTENAKDIVVTNLEDKYRWTLETTEGGIYLKSDNKYAAWTGGNSATMSSTDGKIMKITNLNNGLTTFSFEVNSEETRYLSLNITSGNDYFAFYKTGQQSQLLLLPYKSSTPTAVEQNTQPSTYPVKRIENGRLLISWDGKTYDIIGQEIK